MWNGNSKYAVVHLRGMHERTHQEPTNLDCDAILLLHLNWNLNDGMAIWDLDSRTTGIHPLVEGTWDQHLLVALVWMLMEFYLTLQVWECYR